MKVLYLFPPAEEPGRAGAFGFLDEELHALAVRGIQPYVLSPFASAPHRIGAIRMVPVPTGRTPGELVRTLAFARRSRSWPWGRVRPVRSRLHALRLERVAAEVVRSVGIRVVHSHFGWPSGTGGLLAARAAGVPLVASFRGMDLFLDPEIGYGLRQDPAYDSALRFLLQGADRTLFWGESTRKIGLSLGADPARAVILRKGVDADRFRPAGDRDALLRELGIPAPMIFSVATRLGVRKGLDVTLRALSHLKDSHPFTFVICGEGPNRAALEELADELGLADRVRFVGRLDRTTIAKYFAACDLYVLASRLEAAGNVILEAMASARPVVCTDSGGPPEYCRHGVSGLVVPPNDVEALSKAVRTLLDRPDLAERFGRSGREELLRDMTYSSFLDGLTEVYDAVCETSAATGIRVKRTLAARVAGGAR